MERGKIAASAPEEHRRCLSSPEEKVFLGSEEFSDSSYSSHPLKTILALALWLGAIHLNAALMFFSLLFLPLSKALLFVRFFSSSSFYIYIYIFINVLRLRARARLPGDGTIRNQTLFISWSNTD